jgi:hypothetical protein
MTPERSTSVNRTPWYLGGLSAALLLHQPARADEELNAASAKVFGEAIAAVEKKDWAVCRTKAIGVWQQIKNPKVAGILGICEAELGMHRDAAEHLDFFFANQKGSAATQLQQAQTRFDAVRPKVALLEVTPDPDDAFVTVQGTPIGPGKRRLWVEPGSVSIGIAKNGESKSQTLDLRGGETRALSLVLPPGMGAGGASASGAGNSDPGGAGPAGAGGAGATGGGDPGGAGAGGAGATGEEAPAWPAITLGVAGGVLLAGGIGTLVGGFVLEGAVVDRATGLRCASDPSCQSNEDDFATANTLGAVGITSLILGAAAMTGMIVYVTMTGESETHARLRVSPMGLSFEGSF